ncbi:TetR/AcrR family transcriptional regulator [Glaciimonas sp. GNP009]|uniref:TetR/AcrR family transcriptional regulator n=1 Tax=Glaciimonas sp. CA11.2 TaxID=3048601 RepID=UPI002AB3B59E|nr:TetR/AcrR family transcriptional regulator [Glaciimonas sp. CA11.2]MDY7545109.1 TetR/AcrR family transcriptional regulator [Glaciimonas sp. CA11.2]
MPSSTLTTGTRKAKGQKSERTVEALMVAAQAVFVASGYERATTAEIAQKAGVSEANVFAYFGSKRQLCIEVLRRWYDEISAELERDVPALPGMRARLQFVIRRHLTHLMGEGTGLCALVLGEGRTVDEAFSAVILEFKRRYTAPLVRALHEAQATGELRGDIPVRLMRDMVYGAMEHVLWGYVASGRKPSLEETTQQLTDVFVAGFGSRPYPLEALQRFQTDVKAAVLALEASDTNPEGDPS